MRDSKGASVNWPLSCRLNVSGEIRNRDVTSRLCRLPTVIYGRHDSADECVCEHEVEWYRERVIFRL